MQFHKRTRYSGPPKGAEFPCVLLSSDSWDDYGYTTTWYVRLYLNADRIVMEGNVKLLCIDPNNPSEALKDTPLESQFTQLSGDYCSLGQNLRYYEALRDAGSTIYEPYLTAVRDASYFPEIGSRFRAIRGFTTSLLRFSEAEKAFREARSILTGYLQEGSFRFTFSCLLSDANSPHIVECDFSPHATGLYRTMVIIGRNGTGKTQFLSRFALAMSGVASTDESDDHFHPARPSLSKVIAVSYSVFDDFVRPSSHQKTFSYVYCGVRAPDSRTNADSTPSDQPQTGARFLSPSQLKARLGRALAEIELNGRSSRLLEILQILLEGDRITSNGEIDLSLYDRLSSGQRILVSILTEIIANIERQSIVLFDEPEIHLHPEMFSALIRAFDRLLQDFDSFAIIATHSPLLLQETLSTQVRIFRRIGNSPVVENLGIECFGENLNAITREVFAVDGADHNFRAHLDELAKGRSIGEVEQLFPYGLPLQAKAYLRAMKATARDES